MSKRIAIYARVSTGEQARAGSTSIQKQIDAGDLEAQRIRQFHDGAEVVKAYSDEGVSGATRFEDRPAGAELLKDAARGKFDTVVFYALDRFTRHAAKGLADFEVMEDNLGLTLVFAKENIDTSTASGKLFRTILAAFAEFERDTIRDRAMGGRYSRAEKGQGWVSGMPPYGFEVGEGGNLQTVPHEADVIRAMYVLRGTGMSLAGVAEELNRRGYRPRPRGKHSEHARFSVGAVHAYLTRPHYKGEPIMRQLRPSHGVDAEPFYFEVPRIVDPETWEAAQLVKSLTRGGKSV
jgi:site-specific DNA recombinase